MIILKADQFVNSETFCDSLKLIQGIYSAANNLLTSQIVDRIEYNKIGTEHFYDFTYGWNDFIDGCDNFRKWKFKVYGNCIVEFLGINDWWHTINSKQNPPPTQGYNTFTGTNMLTNDTVDNCKVYSTGNYLIIEKKYLFETNY